MHARARAPRERTPCACASPSFRAGKHAQPTAADTHPAPAGDLYASLVAADLRFSSGWPVGWLEHLLQPLPALSAVGMLPTEPPSSSREPACNRLVSSACVVCACNYYSYFAL